MVEKNHLLISIVFLSKKKLKLKLFFFLFFLLQGDFLSEAPEQGVVQEPGDPVWEDGPDLRRLDAGVVQPQQRLLHRRRCSLWIQL